MKKNILIIDDEEAYAEILQYNLNSTGEYASDVAYSAMEGFEKLRAAKFDLVLLDILMPKIEGREALGEIKRIANIPVIIMSGYLDPRQTDLAINAGASSCFLKTRPFEELQKLIQQALAGKP